MASANIYPLDGGCDCRNVRYRLETRPLFVHCCHCRWCQRESGASFALNAMIEADRVTLLHGEPELIDTPSESGEGQKIARCPICRIAVWSNYAGAGPTVRFVRVGTLDEPDHLPPDIHIFTASRQPWVVLPQDVPAVPEYYDRSRHWPPESLARRKALLARNAASPETVVQHQLNCYNARDLDAWLKTFAEDAQQFEYPSTPLASGRAAIRARAAPRFQEPNLHATLVKRAVMGDIVVDHELVTRTFPEGPGRIEMVCIYKVRDGKIQSVSFVFGAKTLVL